MKKILIDAIRRKQFQFIWAALKHRTLVAMNYYGGSGYLESGELGVIKYVADRVKNEPQPVVFDVGAHKGGYMRQLLQLMPVNTRIYAFEPCEYSQWDLRNIVKEKKNVSVYNWGLGEAKDKLILRYPHMGSALGSLHVYNDRVSEYSDFEKWEEIEVITIDEFCNENNINRIHFLKMDIEGHEFAALKGARAMIAAKKIDCVQFEFGPANIASRTFLKDFYIELDAHYDICRIVRDGIVPLGKYSEENEIFLTANYLAILKQ